MRRISLTDTLETTIKTKMEEVTPQRCGTVMKQIASAITDRTAFESKDGEPSKDIKNLAKLHNDTVARFFVAVGVSPEYYINSTAYDADTFEAKSKVPAIAKTRNLKAYKKFAETAGFFAKGDKLESVLQVFIACSIVSAQYHHVIPRDVCTRFLNSVPLSHVSEELAEALDSYRDKSMSGGADTQTSQCTLQLANMRGAELVRNGRNKDFALDVNSPIVESFAVRFNLVSQLERARNYRATVIAEPATVE